MQKLFVIYLARLLHGGSLPLSRKGTGATKHRGGLLALLRVPLRVAMRLTLAACVVAMCTSFALMWRLGSRDNSSSKGPVPFTPYNTYRTSANSFASVGLAPLRLREFIQYTGCTWHNNDEAQHVHDSGVPGRLKAIHPGEHHNLEYEAVVLHCTLRHTTHSPQGGRLVLHIAMRQREENLLVHEEEAGAYPPARLDPHPPFKYHVAFCSPPLHSDVSAARVLQWLEYHLHLGVDFVILYDAGGINDDVAQMLLPYEKLGLLELRDVGRFLDYETWLYAQVMVINDCAYSTRYLAKWTMFFDMDEFFNADDPPPPHKVAAHNAHLTNQLLAAENWHRQLHRLRVRHRSQLPPWKKRMGELRLAGSAGGNGSTREGGGGGRVLGQVPTARGSGGSREPSAWEGDEAKRWLAEGQGDDEEDEEDEEDRGQGSLGSLREAKDQQQGQQQPGRVVDSEAAQPLPRHASKFLLQKRTSGVGGDDEAAKAKARAEEEERAARLARVRLRMGKQYSGLKTLKEEVKEEEKPTEDERQRHLAEMMREQQSQVEVIRAYREHLQKTATRMRLIPTVLDSYDGASYLSFGTLWWDTQRCVPQEEALGQWAIQRMLYHWPHIYCVNTDLYPRQEMCLDYHGHRKYAINPRKVSALQIHRPVRNDTYGYDLDTTVAKMNHFQGYIQRNTTGSCTDLIRLNDPIVWWARGQELSEIAREAQKELHANPGPLIETVGSS